MDIATQVKKILKITPEAETYFFSDDGSAITPGSTPGNTDRNPRFASDRMVMLDVERSTNIDNLTTLVSDCEEHIPVFEDEAINFLIRPIYSSTDIRLNFRYRTTSKEEAKRWYDDIAIRVSKLRDMFVHSIEYHYSLPAQAWGVIGEIYRKRENIAGYGQSLEQYVQTHTRTKLTLVADGTGKLKLPVVPERQGRIIGQFDFVPLPEKPNYEGDTGTYLITFTYKFTFDSVVAVNIVYPIMVHNQYLESKWIEFAGKQPSPAEIPRVYSESFYEFQKLSPEKELLKVCPDQPYIQIPEIDEFTPRVMHVGTATAMLVLLQILDRSDPLLFTLDDLGDATLHEELLRFIREGEWYYLTKVYKSILNVSLYENHKLVMMDRIRVTADLRVESVRGLDQRSTYHARISLVTDISLLDGAALERLLKYPKLFTLYFSTIDGLLRTRTDFQKLGELTRITSSQLLLLKRLMTGVGPSNEWVHLTKAGGLFKDIPSSVLDDWMRARQRQKTVMTTGIMVFNKSQLGK